MKVLLIKRGAIGDVLMATPLIRQLKRKLNCSVDILISKHSKAAIKNNPYIDQQIILADAAFKLSGVAYLAYRLWLLRGQYEYVFILDKHWYFSLMSLLTGAKRVGFWRDNLARRLLNESVYYYDIERYQVLYYLDLLAVSKLASVDYSDIKLDLIIDDDSKQIVANLLQQLHLENDYVVVVNSGGNNEFERSGIRMLPTDKILMLLKKLLSQGRQVILLGSTVDVNNYDSYIAQLAKPQQLINLAGQLTLAASCQLIKLALHFYTTDCGAMHLGIIADKQEQMTAFFGPTNPKHVLPAHYVENVAIWCDENIYAPQYQLYGIIDKSHPAYFSTLLF